MSFIVTPAQLNRRAELYYQLGSMISAGVPLMKALEMASVNPAVRGSRSTILGIIRCLQSGLTFSESMTRVQGWMPAFDVALLSVGEESGRLDGSFKLLSTHYGIRAGIIRDTIAGLLTTLATLHVFLMVFPLSLLIGFAQGILYNDYAQCLPFLVEKAVVFGALYGGVLLVVYACQGRRGETWRSVVENMIQIIPLLRTAQRYLALSRLAGALEACTTAGVPVIKAWELAGAASGSPRLRRMISSWRGSIESGMTPAELVNQAAYFPEMFANLYHTGEQSGDTDNTLHRLQVYYEEEGFRTLRMFTRIMNGIVYGCVVLLVAYNVFHFYSARFNTIMQGF